MADPPEATLHSPPHSAYFSESQRLCTAANVPQPVAAIPAGPAPVAPPPVHYQGLPYGYPPPFPFQYPPPPYPYTPYPNYPPVVAPPCSDTAPGSTPTSPTKIALPCVISLAEFCE